MNAPVLEFEGRISRPDLAALLDNCGPLSMLSPRSFLGAAALGAPAVSAKVAQAAKVLAAPRTNLTLRIWGDEEAACEMNVLFPTLPVGGQGVVLNPVGQEFSLSGFVDPERVLALLLPVLPPEPAVRPPPFEAQLDCATMIVFAACIDLLRENIRERRVARVLDKRALPDRVLDDATALAGGHIKAYLAAWWGVSRFDQLITCVVPLAVPPRPPTEAEIDAALKRLCDARLLDMPRPDRYAPAVCLEALVAALLGVTAGFQWQRVSEVGPDTLLVVERIFLLGAEGVIVEFSSTPEGLLRMVLRTRGEIAGFLADELSAVSVPPRVESPPPRAVDVPVGAPAVARFCGQCGAARKPGSKFCGSCGAALPPSGG